MTDRLLEEAPKLRELRLRSMRAARGMDPDEAHRRMLANGGVESPNPWLKYLPKKDGESPSKIGPSPPEPAPK